MTAAARAAIASLAIAAVAGCATASSSEMAWNDLLADGLDGVVVVGDANWTYTDGIAEASTGEGLGFLLTPEDYADFEFELDVYVSAEHNSGVFFRCEDRETISDTNCYEANVFDNRPDQSGRTGGIPNIAAPMVMIDAAERWSTYNIRVQGDHIVIQLNGETTIDIRDSTHASAGPIGLQWGAGTVRFRNARVRRL